MILGDTDVFQLNNWYTKLNVLPNFLPSQLSHLIDFKYPLIFFKQWNLEGFVPEELSISFWGLDTRRTSGVVEKKAMQTDELHSPLTGIILTVCDCSEGE